MFPDAEQPASPRHRSLRTATRRSLAALRSAVAIEQRRVAPLAAWTALVLVLGLLAATSVGAALVATADAGVGTAGAGADLQHPSDPVNESATVTLDGDGSRLADASIGGLGGDSVAWMWTAVDSVPGESVVLFGAYSRHGAESPLEHPVRADVDSVVSREPGLHFAEVARRVDSPESTVRHHARVLERENHLQSASVWDSLRLYPAATESGDFELLAALRDDSQSRILRGIARNEPVTVTSLAADVDRAASTVSHHLTRLEEAGLVERERTGQSVRITLRPDVRERLAVPDVEDGDAVEAAPLELVGD